MTPDIRNLANAVRAVGVLDAQRVGRRREETIVAQRWNDVQGIEQSAVLQVRSPFGTPFQLPLRFDDLTEGRDLLAASTPGAQLCIDGVLEWAQREDARYALQATDRGRRVTEVIFRPHRIELASPEDEPGCDVWLEGIVRRSPRLYIHPDRRVQIAVIGLEIQVERTRRKSLARMIEPVEVQIAIPVHHEDAPKMMRQGNRVAVEGMLERVVVPLRDDDTAVQQAVQALDVRWNEREDVRPNREDERRYLRQRQRLQHTVVTRVVAGYARLLEGEPATLAEAEERRAESLRQRTADQATRRQKRTKAAVEEQAGANGRDENTLDADGESESGSVKVK